MAKPFLIDIDQILRSKMGDKANFIPRFATNYLKRIIHQDWINAFIQQETDIVGVQWMEDCVKYLDFTLHIRGIENLPSDANGERFTIVSNHPLGGPEGIVLGSIIGRHYNERIRFMANDLLMNLSGLAPLFVPINKTGKQGRDFPRMVDATFQSDNHLIMFPAGLCSRKIDGKVQDLPWKKTFITKSVETQRDIIPIHFSGHNSEFFYRIANFSKFIGLKFNLAMLYLVDELYKTRGQALTITIGKPLSWKTFTAEKNANEWAAEVRNHVYQLSQQP